MRQLSQVGSTQAIDLSEEMPRITAKLGPRNAHIHMASDDTSESSQDSYFTTSQLVERGWSKAIIAKLLGVPDTYRYPTGMCGGRPAMLYQRARVLANENTDAFRTALAAAVKRRAVLEHLNLKKRYMLLDAAREIEVKVPNISLEALIGSRPWYSATPEALVGDLLRMMQDAEDELDLYRWNGGIREARKELRLRMLSALAGEYPTLAHECARQAALETGQAQPRGEWESAQ
ncbi:hypothetical protein [Cupriavidus sp. USMAA2-4]|uniref:hypothetical protein n=1 Tax=Cupriavidus sp. USMAA2-4 TaxID=876364 RepID=UPI0012F49100|nr:hypothetical protein [Cupriavidus sp. USMAA2-4]